MDSRADHLRGGRKALPCLTLALLLTAPWPRPALARQPAEPPRTAAATTVSHYKSLLSLPEGPGGKETRGLRPISLASADFDGDGIADLAVGYRSPEGGALRVYRGNADAIFPNEPEARQRRANGTFHDLPFEAAPSLIPLAEAPDFLAAGDFDNDRRVDLVFAARGSAALQILPGGWKGGWASVRSISVGGGVTALAAGDLDRPDGLPDLLIGIESKGTSRVLVFGGEDGAINARPELLELAARAAAFAIGRLDDDYAIDFAVASGAEVLLVSGRDVHGAQASASRAVARHGFDGAVAFIALAELDADSEPELAVLTEDGTLHLLERSSEEPAAGELAADADAVPGRGTVSIGSVLLEFDATLSAIPEGASEEARAAALRKTERKSSWRLTRSELISDSPAGLVPLRVTGEEPRSLAVLEAATPVLRLLARAELGMASVAPTRLETIELRDPAAALLSMRLNADGIPDLVVLRQGSNVPEIVMSQAAAVFTVTSAGDQPDCNTSDGICATTSGSCPNGPCTLRAAMMQANASGGSDTIVFSIGSGSVTITPTSFLPILTGAVTIDGTSQPGYAGSPIVEIDGISAGNPANGFTVDGGASTIRGLVIGRFTFRGIELRSSGNFIEGNYVGTNIAGTAARSNFSNGILVNNAPGNVIGGLISQARNVVSGNNGDGIEIFGGSATGNFVQGNYVGTNASGTGPLGNGVGSSCASGADGPGLVVNSASNNTLGGTAAGARNIVSGNLCDGLVISGPTAGGNLIQGNYVGTNAAGTAAVPNSANAFGGGIRIVAPTTTVGGTAAGAGNLVSGNFEDGIELPRPDMFGNVVRGNFVGTDASGAAGLGNEIVGILIPLLPGGTIGGTTAAARNVVAANAYGIALIADAHDILVQGNFIGTNAAGTAALGNAIGGVLIEEGQNITIGGTAAGAGNVISGNLHGVIIANGASTLNKVYGNLIGTRLDGTTALANVGRGVFLTEGAIHNEIGGTAAGTGNTIAFNGGIGVWVEALNTGTGVAKENSILGNRIFSNGGLGIDLDPSGVTANDPMDPDAGSNLRQNFPEITSIGPPNITLAGTLNSAPSTTFRVEFFTSAAADPSGQGEGQTFLGFTNVTTNASGDGTFNVTFPGSLPTNHVVTATATDPAGNTSEYSCAAPCLTNDLEVNVTGDAADTDTGDDLCDADAAPGNQCTLRAAIQTANVRAGTDTITFDIPGAGGHFISATSALPAITQPVILDATSEPGYTDTPLIQLDGVGAGGGANGLLITAGDSTVKGFVITRFGGNGILLQGGGNNTIQGNILGTDANGAPGLGNGQNGIGIDSSSNNTIGGNSAVPLSLHPQAVHSFAFLGSISNMIGGNLLNGIGITGVGSIANKVLGNLSGTIQNLSGIFIKIPNALAGLKIDNAKQTEVGALNAGNLFSGNGQFGVQITGQGAQLNKLFANIIGTNPNGATGFGNGKDGVSILDAVQTRIGGDTPGEGNTIAGNLEYGIQLQQTATDCITQMLTEMYRNAVGIFQSIQLSTGPGKRTPAQPAFIGLANVLGGLKINNAAGNILGKLGVAGELSNLIAANLGPGVTLTGPCAKLNKLQNNGIGTDQAGTAGLGNTGEGVLIEGGSENEIGGASASLGNVISGNLKDGIKLKSLPSLLARLNKLAQNNIGGKPDGSGPLGNLLNGINADTAPETMIDSNAIVGNSRYGIYSENASLQQLQAQQRQLFDQVTKILEIYNNTAGTIVSGIGRQTAGGPSKSSTQFINIGNLLGGMCMNGALKNIIGGPGGLANIISGNQGPGVHLRGITATLNKLLGNYIGTTPTGLAGFGNSGQGVFIEGAPNNEIGGLGTGEGNVISGNQGDGILLKSISDSLANLNKILGNNIGAKPDGSGPLGNLLNGINTDTAPNTLIDSNITVASGRYGVYSENTQLNALTAQMRQLFDQASEMMKMLKNASGVYTTALRSGQLSVGEVRKSQLQFINMGNLLGGMCLNGALKNIIGGPGGLGNLFAGNQGPGVHMRGISAILNKLLGNYIGTTPTGLAGFGNSGQGVFVEGAPNNEIGGLGTGEGNVISGNQGDGILLKSLSASLANLNKILGNNIGAKPDGSGPLGNLLNGINADTVPNTLIDSNITVANGRYGVYSENTQLNALNAQMRQLFDQASEMMKMLKNVSGVYTTALRSGQLSVGEVRKSQLQFVNMGNLLGGLCLNGALKNIIGGPGGLGNLFSGNQGPGVHIRGITGILNKLLGNHIGTTPTGLPGFGNSGDGVFIDGAPENLVDANTIVSNILRGIRIQDPSARLNQLLRNLVGVYQNLQGQVFSLPNLQGGILISDSPENTIGSPILAAGTAPLFKRSRNSLAAGLGGNVVSANGGPGIALTGNEARQNLVQSNLIGMDFGGTPFGNSSHGVFLTSSARLNVIGGQAADSGNVIGFNAGAGVSLDATAGHCNLVDPNSIFANAGLGIDLNSDGTATPNDVGDPDNGPNKLQNFPEMTSANIQPNGELVIQYKVDSNPANSNYGATGLLVEFFKADSGLEGRSFAGNTRYTAANYATGVVTVNLGPAAARGVYPGDSIVATASDADNNTSEFTSTGVGVIPGPPSASFYTLDPCRVVDTRNAPGPLGGPALSAGVARTFTIAGQCGIPVTAKAVSFNVTVDQPTGLGHMALFPGGTGLPLVSTINFSAGQTRANNAIVPVGTGGTLTVFAGQNAGNTVHFILDVNGYFE